MQRTLPICSPLPRPAIWPQSVASSLLRSRSSSLRESCDLMVRSFILVNFWLCSSKYRRLCLFFKTNTSQSKAATLEDFFFMRPRKIR